MRVFVIGLDCAEPTLVFEKFKEDIPNLRKLYETGLHGTMRSTTPPITIPAWMVMATSKNPGKLGLYGFRHRKNYSYEDIWIANSLKIKEKTVWDIAGENGLKSIIIGFPPTYPPKPINGFMITDFITPGIDSEWTYPKHLKDEILMYFDDYIFDVVFRTDKKDEVIKELYKMTEIRFDVINHFLENVRDWSLFWFVEIGVDRVHHAFWKYMDENHHLYPGKGNKYENVIRDYYRYIDRRIGEILKKLPEDTVVIVVSDHGAKRMKGSFCINEWLIEQGYLKLKKYPDEVVDLTKADVDWANTIAWGWGGYYARIFLNVKGRERMGVVEPDEYEDVRDEIARKIKEIRGPNGEEWNTLVLKPEEVYPELNGDPPDLMVFLDDLYWRSAGTIGWKKKYLEENDKGPDDAVHNWDGIFIISGPGVEKGKRHIDIRDIAPTILHFLGIEIPDDMEGNVVR